MSKTIITIEHFEAGQPRPYADSRYRAKISVERHGVYTNGKVIPRRLTQDEAETLVQMFVHEFDSSESPPWYRATLKALTPEDAKEVAGEKRAASWEALVVDPYKD